ncbi:MAG: hypothetical protein WBD31_12555 [Rubripirellula sp.]
MWFVDRWGGVSGDQIQRRRWLHSGWGIACQVYRSRFNGSLVVVRFTPH